MCAFGQNGLVFGEEAVDFVLAVDDAELFEVFDPLEPLPFQFVDIVVVTQRFENVLVTRLGHFVNLLEVEEDVAHTHAVAADLVRIGRADALARGADFRTALRRFERSVQHAVRGQDQVRLFRDVEPLRQVVAAAGQCLGLLLEEDRVEHHAVANHVDLIALKYTRRDRTQHVLLPVELQCMPGIGATLKAGHDLIMGGQHIDHLAFSFVAPLQTENDIDFFHLFSVICFMQKTFFAFKDTNYSPKYPIPLRDFSTNCQESGVAGALPTGTRNPLSLQSKGRKSRSAPIRVLGGSACGIVPPPAGRTPVRNAVCGGNEKPDRPLGKSGSAPAAPAVRFPRRRPSPPPPGSSPPGCRRRP